MTFCQAVYRYENRLTEKHLGAMDILKGQVYGLRRIAVDDQDRLIRVDYDATRIEPREIGAVLRSIGVRISESGEEADRAAPK